MDDDENDVAFMMRAWEAVGIADGLQVAAEGAEALEYLSGHGEFGDRIRYPLPVLIFLDLKLPRMMGIDLLTWIRNQPELQTVVVIVLTSSKQQSDIRMGCSLGANSYLVKPSNPIVELTTIMQLIKHYWLGLNHPTATIRPKRDQA